MLTLGPTLETPRLTLRPPAEQDFDAWAEMHEDAETMRFIGGTSPRAATWRILAQVAGMWALRGFGMFSVIERATGRWLGRVGPLYPAEWPAPEVGWGLHPAAQGQGFAAEAAARCMDFVIDDLGWPDVIHCIAPENVNSQKLALRLGSANRGPGRLPAPFADAAIDIWGQTATDWRARRHRAVTG